MLRQLVDMIPAISVAMRDARLWTYQRVSEYGLEFDRIYYDAEDGRRVALHQHEHSEAPLYWHPHTNPIAVISNGYYELNLRGSRIVMHGGVYGYELMGEHAVRYHAQTLSIVLFGNSEDRLDESSLYIDMWDAATLTWDIPELIEAVKR